MWDYSSQQSRYRQGILWRQVRNARRARVWGGVLFESGGGRIFVYESGTAGTGQATCASWSVPDVDSVVTSLKALGVVFEKYDMPGVTWEGDVAIMGDMKSAWFKDPDGNILNVTNM